MHGFIYIEFEKFVLSQLPYRMWEEVVIQNNLVDREYSPLELYPDDELRGLLTTVSEKAGQPVEELLEKFGTYMVPDLMKVYRAYINPEWKTLDLLEHAESTIHTAVRKSTTGAAPPILEVARTRPNEIEIKYISKRKMVELGVGIIKGLAEFFNESHKIQVTLTKNEAEGTSLIVVRDFS